jgi:hypothetical protein
MTKYRSKAQIQADAKRDGSWDRAEQVKQLLDDYRSGKITLEEANAKLAEIAPELVATLRAAAKLIANRR